jgi:hypothetical protein
MCALDTQGPSLDILMMSFCMLTCVHETQVRQSAVKVL